MPNTKYALDPGGPKRLELRWSGLWKNMAVQLDGEEIGTIPSSAELKQGQRFTLPDGSTLQVKLISGFGNTELQVTRDGRPLPGSASDPAERVKAAGYIIYFIAALSFVIGLVATLFHVEVLEQLGIGWPSLVAAAIYAVLGFFVLRKKSKVALIIAIALFILDGVITMVTTIGARGTPPTGGIIMRVFLILPMIRGVSAIDQIKKGDDESVKKVFD